MRSESRTPNSSSTTKSFGISFLFFRPQGSSGDLEMQEDCCPNPLFLAHPAFLLGCENMTLRAKAMAKSGF